MSVDPIEFLALAQLYTKFPHRCFATIDGTFYPDQYRARLAPWQQAIWDLFEEQGPVEVTGTVFLNDSRDLILPPHMIICGEFYIGNVSGDVAKMPQRLTCTAFRVLRSSHIKFPESLETSAIHTPLLEATLGLKTLLFHGLENVQQLGGSKAAFKLLNTFRTSPTAPEVNL